MRHAEPKQQVQRNGVIFTPADIKALLAEIYIYNDTENLCGFEYTLNPGAFHAVLTNWIGRASYPVGMEADPGQEKWNYPIYEYKTTTRRLSPSQVEVQMNIGYAKDSRGEFQQSPRIKYVKYFSYLLNLNTDGEIVGGYFYRGSSLIDLLWIPLQPKPGGSGGNQRGNPHVDVDEVLAIWRDSVPAETRRNWLVVDPPNKDRLNNVKKLATGGKLVPVQTVRPRVIDTQVVTASATSEDDTSVVTAVAEENRSAATNVAPPASSATGNRTYVFRPATPTYVPRPVTPTYVPRTTTTRRGLFGFRRSR